MGKIETALQIAKTMATASPDAGDRITTAPPQSSVHGNTLAYLLKLQAPLTQET